MSIKIAAFATATTVRRRNRRRKSVTVGERVDRYYSTYGCHSALGPIKPRCYSLIDTCKLIAAFVKRSERRARFTYIIDERYCSNVLYGSLKAYVDNFTGRSEGGGFRVFFFTLGGRGKFEHRPEVPERNAFTDYPSERTNDLAGKRKTPSRNPPIPVQSVHAESSKTAVIDIFERSTV